MRELCAGAQEDTRLLVRGFRDGRDAPPRLRHGVHDGHGFSYIFQLELALRPAAGHKQRLGWEPRYARQRRAGRGVQGWGDTCARLVPDIMRVMRGRRATISPSESSMDDADAPAAALDVSCKGESACGCDPSSWLDATTVPLPAAPPDLAALAASPSATATSPPAPRSWPFWFGEAPPPLTATVLDITAQHSVGHASLTGALKTLSSPNCGASPIFWTTVAPTLSG